MEKEKKKYNKILVTVLTIGLLFAAMFFLSVDIASKKNDDKVDITKRSDEIKFSVLLKIDDGSKEKKEYELSDISKQTTVFDVLKNNADIKYNNNYSYGVFIESINGIKNGDDGKYWQYYINDVLGDVAADKKVLKEGNNIEWRFEEVPF
ncbi:MAG: DUF4430 domain-containing protein [Candidatus Andersenbacteria bacterium]|nr:DUF4430 domain-containing protein [Candidatus Andersenbacteria bacterium]